MKQMTVLRETREGDVLLRELAGPLDEQFQSSSVDPGVSKIAVLDMAAVDRVTSFGVREWIRAIGAVGKQLEGLFFVRASPRVVDQFNMIVGFDGGGSLLSFLAGFACDACGRDSTCLFDTQLDRPLFQSLDAPVRQCRICGSDADLDDVPNVLFEYVRAATPMIPPASVLQMLRSGVSWAHEVPGVRLSMRQNVTFGTVSFQLAGIIDASFSARRIVDCGGDTVVIDLRQVAHFDLGGIAPWKEMLAGLAGKAKIRLVGCPPVFLRRVVDMPTLAAGVEVESFAMPGHCAACTNIDWSVVAPREVKAWLEASRVCSSCGKPVQSADLRARYAGFLEAMGKGQTLAPESVPAPAEGKARMRADKKEAKIKIAFESAAQNVVAEKYEVLCKLAEGGMAEVYLARLHGVMGFRRLVVVKKIKDDLLTDAQMIRLFLEEAKLVARIDHPNVIRVLDFGREEGAYHMVLEHVHGRSLAQAMQAITQRGEVMPSALAATIVADLCRGLARAHRRDSQGQVLVHRDVTLNNVMVTFDGVTKLLDFGLAGYPQAKVKRDTIMGSPPWIAPETYQRGEYSPQTDMWGAGLSLMVMLTGKHPFRRQTPQATANAVINEPIKRPFWSSKIPRRLFRVIKRSLAKKPEDRYLDASEMETDLRRAAGKLKSSDELGLWMRTLFHDELARESEFAQRCGKTSFVDALLDTEPTQVVQYFEKSK